MMKILIACIIVLAACSGKPGPNLPDRPSTACSTDADCLQGHRCDTCPSTCPPGTEACPAVCGEPVCVASTAPVPAPATCGTDADCGDGQRCNTCPPPDGCKPGPGVMCPAVCGTPVCGPK